MLFIAITHVPLWEVSLLRVVSIIVPIGIIRRIEELVKRRYAAASHGDREAVWAMTSLKVFTPSST